MGLDIWFREDITNALRAADVASSTTIAAVEDSDVQGDVRYLRAYREGWRAALATIALAFGLGEDNDHDYH